MKGEPLYKCGHYGKPIILDDNALSLSAYMDWSKENYNPVLTMCWDCWCKRVKNVKKRK